MADQAQSTATVPPVEDLSKVFVGNISFKTKSEDLTREFSTVGTVVAANIITRGTRSLGYGFVQMGSPAEAELAVQRLDKKEIDGRSINVEVVKPRTDKPPRAAPSGDDAVATTTTTSTSSSSTAQPSRGRRVRRNAPTTRAGESDHALASDATASGDARRPRRRPRRSAASIGGEVVVSGDHIAHDATAAAATAPRRVRAARELRPRTESDTTLFVANLPFTVDDEALAAVFAGFKVTKAHVVRKPNDRSKGFGFVEFATHDDQQAALAKDKTLLVDRELSIKVALTAPPTDNAAAAAAAATTDGASSSSNA